MRSRYNSGDDYSSSRTGRRRGEGERASHSTRKGSSNDNDYDDDGQGFASADPDEQRGLVSSQRSRRGGYGRH